MTRKLRDEAGAAVQARPGLGRDAVTAAAVGVERRVAVRADDPQVPDPVVVRDAVDVVEDEPHDAASPHLVLPTKLAVSRLESGGEQPCLETSSAVAGMLDEHLLESNGISAERAVASAVGIEMIGGDLPDLVDPAPEELVIAAGRT